MQAVAERPGTTDPTVASAIAATTWVFALPAAAILLLVGLLDPDPPLFLVSLVGGLLSCAASVVGTIWWDRRPGSAVCSFGDLMLWSWMRRRDADQTLAREAAVLGLDATGARVGRSLVSREAQLKALHELNEALERKDPYTRGHSRRVERHAYRTGLAMGLSVKELEDLRLAAALHDIGKIRVPGHILTKPGKLDPVEWAAMQEHSAVGAWILSEVTGDAVVQAVRYHHERWDGLGYPEGISGERIPLFSRIIAVADTFDAVTSNRPYRTSSDRSKAIDILQSGAGTQWDPFTVEVFLANLPSRSPIAAAVMLFPGTRFVLSQIARLMRRAGTASLTATAAASVVVGTVVAAPYVEPRGAREIALERSIVAGESHSNPKITIASSDASAFSEVDPIALSASVSRSDGNQVLADEVRGFAAAAVARQGTGNHDGDSGDPKELPAGGAAAGSNGNGNSFGHDQGVGNPHGDVSARSKTKKDKKKDSSETKATGKDKPKKNEENGKEPRTPKDKNGKSASDPGGVDGPSQPNDKPDKPDKPKGEEPPDDHGSPEQQQPPPPPPPPPPSGNEDGSGNGIGNAFGHDNGNGNGVAGANSNAGGNGNGNGNGAS